MVAGIGIPDAMLMPDAVECLEQRELETRSLIAGGERASLLKQSERRKIRRFRYYDRMRFRRLETFDVRRLVESVGSFFLRVILIGSIFVEVLVASKVGAAIVASPVGVLELDTHSSSAADPSESSPPPISVAPMVSPFLCLDDSESDNEIPNRHVSPKPHDAMLTRWRSRAAL
nr:hypothetical protein [Tanacetum cinerariifolium]